MMGNIVKFEGAIGLAIFGFLLMFNGNLWPNTTPLRDIRSQNLSDLELYLSMLLKFKHYSAIYKWPYKCTSTTQNLNDLDFDLSKSLKIKSNSSTKLHIHIVSYFFKIQSLVRISQKFDINV